MKRITPMALLGLLALGACGGGLAGEGEECEIDEDCEAGLHCHPHEGEDHGECEVEEEGVDSGM